MSGLGLEAAAHSVAREGSAGRFAYYSGPSLDSGWCPELGLPGPRTGLKSGARSSSYCLVSTGSALAADSVETVGFKVSDLSGLKSFEQILDSCFATHCSSSIESWLRPDSGRATAATREESSKTEVAVSGTDFEWPGIGALTYSTAVEFMSIAAVT